MDWNIVLRHGRYAKWLAFKIAGDGDIALYDDAVQNAKLLLYAATATYTAEKGSFIAYTKRWVLRSLQELHVPALTCGIRVPRYALGKWAEKVPQVVPIEADFDVADAIVRDIIDIDKFWSIIRSELNDVEFEIVSYSYRDKLSLKKIGEKLQLHYTTVSRLQHRAITKLRQCERL